MKISLNTIKSFTEVPLSPDELAEKLNRQLGGVEAVNSLGSRYAGAIIVRVVSCRDHPDADRLHVCLVDDGGTVPGVVRNENGYVQVVCGAPNVKQGMDVVWLPPGATVPSSYETSEPFVLDARKLRGVMSNGMLASAKELALGDDHDGILEIIPTELRPPRKELIPGTSFAEVVGLDDVTIDIENKMFTHRPDCFGQLGVAREIAGIQHQPFTSPDWYLNLPEFYSGDGLELSVQNNAKDKVPRFMAVGLKGVTVRQSPLWLKAELVRLGAKPINNIVDATNYVMLLTAQPTHAYDLAKLRGRTLATRMAQAGESLTLLNHKTYMLDDSDIVITDAEGPVGLAGIMGGGDSEVSDETESIVLECATFDMYTVRRSSMRHGLFTDALTRFNKGQSPFQNAYILKFLIDLILEVAGGEVATHVFDDSIKLEPTRPLVVETSFINQRLGLELSAKECQQLLTNVEFDVTVKNDSLNIAAPYWRTDIELPEDIVEEVGRLYGFDKLPRELPKRSAKPATINGNREYKRRIREILATSGCNEVLTYSFVHEKTIMRAGQDPRQAFRLSNALSPDLQYYRVTVLPSLLDKVHANIKSGHDEFAFFEIGKGHNKTLHLNDDDGLPSEQTYVDMVYASKKSHEGAAFYRVKALVENLAHSLGIEQLTFDVYDEDEISQVSVPFNPDRTATIKTADGAFLGYVGELKLAVRRGFKLPEYAAAATLAFDALTAAARTAQRSYTPLSRYPSVTQDISLSIAANQHYAILANIVKEVVTSYEADNAVRVAFSPLSIYQPDNADTKTITFRLKVTSEQQTLTDAEVSELLDLIAQQAATVHATRV